jgi:hypothetical protein
LTETVHEAIREGITRHGNGLPATDPLTGQVLPPPGDVEEVELGWFLDHFSARELTRLADRGAGAVQAGALLSTLGSLAVCVLGSMMAMRSINSLEQAPGVGAVLWIVSAGLGLSAVVYHGIRLVASRRLSKEAGSPDQIRRHVENISRAWHLE